jgi:hypothetical protein
MEAWAAEARLRFRIRNFMADPKRDGGYYFLYSIVLEKKESEWSIAGTPEVNERCGSKVKFFTRGGATIPKSCQWPKMLSRVRQQRRLF